MSDECPHSMVLTPDTCTLCLMQPGRRREPAQPLTPVAVPASYPGHCEACNLPINVGQVIVMDPVNGWVHQGCAT